MGKEKNIDKLANRGYPVLLKAKQTIISPCILELELGNDKKPR